MTASSERKALLVLTLVIGALTAALVLLGLLAIEVFGIPVRFHLPAALRVAGAGLLAVGFSFMGWLFRYRKPGEILLSTYVTMRTSGRRQPPRQESERTEPLILAGPQRHVRHPLYFAVVVMILGWWLLVDYTVLILMACFFFLWFTQVVIRFEEKELRALFGEEYEAYARAVPMIIPSPAPRWPSCRPER